VLLPASSSEQTKDLLGIVAVAVAVATAVLQAEREGQRRARGGLQLLLDQKHE
jgi:hypothetical protein